MQTYNDMTLEELTAFFQSIGEPSYRAKQLYHFLHREKGTAFDPITVFNAALKQKLLELGTIGTLHIRKVYESKIDGTRKYLLALPDGQIVESVYMPYADRSTVCISTQVGCRMGCAFCASTKARFQRNLHAWEILEEIYTIERDLSTTIDNVVLMGIGEPLDNYDNVMRFLRILHSEEGRNLSLRNVTLSTSGLAPKIRDLAEEEMPINLAISLHSTTDENRRKTMPVANKYSIAEVIDACAYYFEKTGRRVSFEYVLLHGENDTKEDVMRLRKLVGGPKYHVNLIPLNPISEFDGSKAADSDMAQFQKALERHGVNATIRSKKGADIDAACGQLRIAYEASHPDKLTDAQPNALNADPKHTSVAHEEESNGLSFDH